MQPSRRRGRFRQPHVNGQVTVWAPLSHSQPIAPTPLAVGRHMVANPLADLRTAPNSASTPGNAAGGTPHNRDWHPGVPDQPEQAKAFPQRIKRQCEPSSWVTPLANEVKCRAFTFCQGVHARFFPLGAVMHVFARATLRLFIDPPDELGSPSFLISVIRARLGFRRLTDQAK